MAMPGFTIAEISPWQEGGELWRGLRVRFPEAFAGHSREQDFYFGDDFLLRRHDYQVDVAGGFPTAQYVHDIVEVEGSPLSNQALYVSARTKSETNSRPAVGLDQLQRLPVELRCTTSSTWRGVLARCEAEGTAPVSAVNADHHNTNARQYDPWPKAVGHPSARNFK
jgi:hypothetical protein